MIVVFGSINMDLVTRTPRLPMAGETLTGHTFATVPGGKGANQAVACARLGMRTKMIGRVGADVFGEALRDSLRTYGVDTSGVMTLAGRSSGIAAIAVDDAAENTIIVVPGANGAIGTDDLARLELVLKDARGLLLQLEIPMDAVVAAARLAHQRGVTVILDPAPARPLPSELYSAVDILTPNETEATALVGSPIRDEAQVERAVQILIKRGAGAVVIKLGSRGAYWNDGKTGRFESAFPAQAVDTVAAGDAFNGALAVALAENLGLEQAVRWGLAAGALSVTKAGAQPSMPDRASVVAMLHRTVDEQK